MIPEDGDSSGIFLHYTRYPQPKTAGVLLLGTSGFAPRHSTTYFETACQMNDDREIHPFAFRTHAHQWGSVIKGYKYSQESDEIEEIAAGNPQWPQQFYPIKKQVTVNEGEYLLARCTFNNSDGSRDIHIGMLPTFYHHLRECELWYGRLYFTQLSNKYFIQ